LKTIISGIEPWMLSHVRKYIKNAEYAEGIFCSLFLNSVEKVRLILAVDGVRDLVGLGNVLDRVLILCEMGLIDRIIGLSSYCVYDNKESTAFSESDTVKPRNFVGMRASSLESFLSYVSERYEVAAVSLRAFNIYGPFQEKPYLVPSLLAQAISGNIVNIGDSDKVRDFLYIGDLARAISILLSSEPKRGYKVYNVGSGKGTKIGELFSMIKVLTTNSAEPIFDATKLREEYDYDYAVADITRIKKELGWEPKVSLEEGLALTYQWILGRSVN